MLPQILLSLACIVIAIPPYLGQSFSKDLTEIKITNISHTYQASENSTSVNRVEYRCDGPRYGYDLNPRSCLQAWSFIPWSMTTELSFGERDEAGTYDVGLPKRYLSSDGTCAIEPILRPPARLPSRTSPKAAAIAALSVIRRCANDHPSTGGAAINFGGDNNLAILVYAFVPHVQCYGRVGGPGIRESCAGILDRMNASKTPTAFGPLPQGDAVVQLPYTIRADSRCAMTISTPEDQVDHSSWYTFWAAATAINAMCVGAGKAGLWANIGSQEHLFIVLRDESLDDASRPSGVLE